MRIEAPIQEALLILKGFPATRCLLDRAILYDLNGTLFVVWDKSSLQDQSFEDFTIMGDLLEDNAERGRVHYEITIDIGAKGLVCFKWEFSEDGARETCWMCNVWNTNHREIIRFLFWQVARVGHESRV